MADDKVMSQAEIDALVARVPVKPGAPKPAQTGAPKAPPPPPPPKQPVAEKPAAAVPIASAPKAPAPPPAPPLKQPVAEKPAPPAPVSVPKAAPPPARPAVAERPPAAAPAAPPPVPVEGKAKYEKYSSGEVGSLQSIVADLARQVGKMTNAMQKLESMEEKVNTICSLLKLEPGDTHSLGARLDEIYARLDAIQKASVQNEFVCAHCQTHQMMALHVKCTSCGEEAWMGWWPEGNRK